MNNQRTAIAICAALGMLATFLPWAHVQMSIIDTSISGTKGDGWITFVIFAVPLILALMGDRTQGLTSGLVTIAALAGLVAAGVGIYKIVDFNSTMNKVTGGGDDSNIFGSMLSSSVSIGFGLYLVVIAGVATALAAFVIKPKVAAPQNIPPVPPVV